MPRDRIKSQSETIPDFIVNVMVKCKPRCGEEGILFVSELIKSQNCSVVNRFDNISSDNTWVFPVSAAVTLITAIVDNPIVINFVKDIYI